jgi:hypothetical protein
MEAKSFGLFGQSLNQVGTAESFRESGIIFDPVGDNDLPADHDFSTRITFNLARDA